MEFIIVGNPPFADNSINGGQNKIYNMFSKQALIQADVVAFVTPTSVCKKSKRFSLIDITGLKYVDFTANNHFNVGVKICSWIVDKSYDGDVEVVYDDSTITVPKGEFIYDTTDNLDFKILYRKCKTLTDKPQKRMFHNNNFGPALSRVKTDIHIYKLHKLTNGLVTFTYYSPRKPKWLGKVKMSIAITKLLTEKAIYVGVEDFDQGYMTIGIDDPQEVENIKSFILSDYFIEHCNKWKMIDGNGFNASLKYLPPFDTSHAWTNDTVREFFETL
jgi:hypothetical protein